MKPTGRAVFLLIVATVSAFTCLYGIAAGQSGQPRSGQISERSGPPRRLIERTYTFHDENDVSASLTCRIDEEALEKAVADFGLPVDESAMWTEVSRRLGRLAEQRAKRSGLWPYIIKIHTSAKCGPTGCQPLLKVEFQATLPAWTRTKLADYKRWIQETLEQKNSLLADEIKQYYFERGFILRKKGRNGEKDELAIDYRGLAARGTEGLEDCFREIQKTGGDLGRQAFRLGALFQDMAFDYPPPMEAGLVKAEFWVPAQVMSLQKGDCDSKSAAFCSIWRNNPTPVLLIHQRSLGSGQFHTLVALEGLPMKGDAVIRLGLRTFVLYDIAGGDAKPHPGVSLERRSHVGFECIPPKSSNGDACPPESSWVDWLGKLLPDLW